MAIATDLTAAPTGAGLRRRAWDRMSSSDRAIAFPRWAFRGVLAAFVALILLSYAVPLWYQLHGDRLLVVTSGSMAPEIQAGDAVVIRPVTSASQLRVDQIVTYYPVGSAQLVTHRIKALTTVVRRDEQDRAMLDQNGNPIEDPYIKTKGDANESSDPNLTPSTQVRGIVREIHPAWGYALGWAHSPTGRLLLFAPPLLMLLGAELLSHVPAHRRRRSTAPWWRRGAAVASDDAGAPTSTGMAVADEPVLV
jgi:signal peptidase